MLAHRPHKACLRPFVSLRFRESDLLANLQFFEKVIHDAVTMKVDFAAVAALDEAVLRAPVNCRDDAVRRGLMFFHMASAFADEVLKLPARGLERITDGQIDILMRPRDSRLMAHRDVCGIGNNEMDPDVIDVALMMTVLGARYHDTAAYDPAEKLFELFSLLSDTCLDSIGMLNAFEGDLKWSLHREPRCTPPCYGPPLRTQAQPLFIDIHQRYDTRKSHPAAETFAGVVSPWGLWRASPTVLVF